MEEIQKVIAEIEQKIAKMRSSMNNVQVENVTLKEEIELLNKKLSQREQETKDFQTKYNELMHQSEKLSFSETKENNNSQIDALVREIDDCISRLKAE